MNTRPLIHAAAATHVGRVRARNEDTVWADPLTGLVAVADGLGGRNAGDMASRLAIESLAHELPKLVSGGLHAPHRLLQHAVALANTKVFTLSTRIPGCVGMGTTLVAGWFIETAELGRQLVIAHVGDSRLYRYRPQLTSTLTLLTRDHSSAQALVDEGLYTAEAARRLPQRHMLTRALGVEPDVEIDILTTPVLDHDLVLLCSDGLSNMLGDDELLRMLAIHPTTNEMELQSLAHMLIEAANERGGHDNISVVLATPAS